MLAFKNFRSRRRRLTKYQTKLNTDIVLGDLFEIGEHRLLCGDSTQVDTWQKVMDDKLCDMVMTDPPYNVDYQGGTGLKIMNDKMENNTFYQFLYDFYTALGSYTKKGGAWYVWHADSEGANFRQAMKDAGIMVKQCLIWVKNSMVMGRQDYQWKHEPCLYGWKEGAAHYFTSERTHTTVIEDKLDIKKLTKDEMKKMLTEMLSDKNKTTIIHCDKPHRSAEHPTMKPILLLAPLIQNSSKENEIVADGFLGSGSTMVASHQLKRKCYGMELDPKYCQVIIDRMRKLDPNLVIKRNGIELR
jgi:DNA modification methylase